MNKKVYSSIIFLIIGGLLLVIGFLIRTNTFESSLLSNIAIVLLTVAILNFLWSLLGGDPTSNALEQLSNSLQKSFQIVDSNLQKSFQIVNDSNMTGLTGITTSRKFPRTRWIEKLRGAQQQVDLMGYTLFSWIKTTHFEEEILKLVRRGVEIRVLIMDEVNPSFGCFINDDLAATSIERTKTEIKHAMKVFESTLQKVQTMKNQYSHQDSFGDFQLRAVRKGLITCNMCRADTEITVITYLYCQQAGNSPLFTVCQNNNEESNLFQTYQEEFNQLWELNFTDA